MARAILSNLDFGSVARIVGLLSPSAADEPATKAYVDSAVEGLAWKDSCRVASTANINLSSPGATIDGITMATNDRILAKDQSTQSQNGIYVWNGAATPATRAVDASTSAELEQAVVTVEEGTSAGATFRQTTINFTLDTGNVVWTAFGTSAPSASETLAGVIEIATQAEMDAGTDDARAVTPAKVKNWSLATKRFQQNIGDGSATQYTVTHNLNTRDVAVAVIRNSGNYDDVGVDIERTSVNAVRITFASAPSSNAYRVIVIA